jgi:ABC-2 type transport system ATP-binding protein
VLAVSHLRKTFGDLVAVDDVSFELGPGQLLGLLGPNGAGKTTTVSMIAGLVTPDQGDVLIGGARLAGDTDPSKRRIGLRGIGLDGAVLPTLVLLGFALVFGALAVIRFRWEEGEGT